MILPVGTIVQESYNMGLELGQVGTVGKWCKQDGYNVPIDFEDGSHAICCQPFLIVLLRGDDPLLQTNALGL